MSMNKYLIISFTLIILCSCENISNKNKINNIVSKSSDNNLIKVKDTLTSKVSLKEKNVHSVIKQKNVYNLNTKIDSTQFIKEIIPDTTINNKLILNNYNSIQEFYSENENFKIIDNGIRESPYIIFKNKQNTQYLLSFQYEGDVKNSFDCFEIGYFEDDYKIEKSFAYTIEEDYFYTESKLKLGISFEEIVRIKGNSYKIEGTKSKGKMVYRINDYKKSSFLKRYHMPGYFIEITLIKNKIRKILFGFDYP